MGGGKAIVAGPLKKDRFCGFPNTKATVLTGGDLCRRGDLLPYGAAGLGVQSVGPPALPCRARLRHGRREDVRRLHLVQHKGREFCQSGINLILPLFI